MRKDKGTAKQTPARNRQMKGRFVFVLATMPTKGICQKRAPLASPICASRHRVYLVERCSVPTLCMHHSSLRTMYLLPPVINRYLDSLGSVLDRPTCALSSGIHLRPEVHPIAAILTYLPIRSSQYLDSAVQRS